MAAILSQFVNMIYNIWSISDGCNYNVIRGHHGSVSTVSICCRAWWSTDAQHHKHHSLRKRFTLYVLKCFRKHKTVFISFPMTETVQRNEIISDGKHWHIFYIFILMSVINWERQEPGYSRHTIDLTLQECTGFCIEGLKKSDLVYEISIALVATWLHYGHVKTVFVRNVLYFHLTHWGRVMHICVDKLTTIGSDNGLSLGRRQAIIWTNAAILFIGPLGTNFGEILIEIIIFSLKKMRLKV